jgi:sugar-specific transcriptional regulator TrmB
MEEDLAKRLSDFGFTVNQAKVYVSIVQSGSTCVSRISESTHLHRQDIYKILPKLEEMGLIVKTIDTPFMIKAVPVKNALNSLVSTERKKANERISRLETNLKEMTNAIRKQQERRNTREEERWLILLTTDAEIKNIADLTFENARIECDLVMNLELITRLMPHFREHFQKIAIKGARIRIIVENLNNEHLVKRTLEKIRPNGGDFAAKLIFKSESVPYQIIDHKELWIGGKKETESCFPCVLWTNGRNMVKFFDESFKETWNNRHAISIYPERDVAEEKISNSPVNDTKHFNSATDLFFIK